MHVIGQRRLAVDEVSADNPLHLKHVRAALLRLNALNLLEAVNKLEFAVDLVLVVFFETLGAHVLLGGV